MSEQTSHSFLAQSLWSIFGAVLVVVTYLFVTRRPDPHVTPLPTAQRMSRAIESIELRDASLDAALDVVAKKAGVSFKMDWTAIRKDALRDGRVDLRLTNVPAHVAIDQIAWQLHFRSAIRSEEDHIVVSTPEQLPPAIHAVTRLYEVEDLLRRSAEFNTLFPRPPARYPRRQQIHEPHEHAVASLVSLIESMDDSWRPFGTPGAIEYGFGRLAIRQTVENHQQIQKLIVFLRGTEGQWY